MPIILQQIEYAIYNGIVFSLMLLQICCEFCLLYNSGYVRNNLKISWTVCRGEMGMSNFHQAFQNLTQMMED